MNDEKRFEVGETVVWNIGKGVEARVVAVHETVVYDLEVGGEINRNVHPSVIFPTMSVNQRVVLSEAGAALLNSPYRHCEDVKPYVAGVKGMIVQAGMVLNPVEYQYRVHFPAYGYHWLDAKHIKAVK